MCLPLAACDYAAGRDALIKDSTEALETAHTDVARAKAYSARGVAYGDKARVSRKFKVPPTDEYERLFGQALKDHNEAIRLNPNSAEMYFNRAKAFYDRGTWALVEEKDGKPWLDQAAADFEKATKLDPADYMGFDMLGLTDEQNGESDKAIVDYTKELALNPFGRQRLADAYCMRGFQHQQKKEYIAAAVEYEKSIDFGTADDKSCPYDPYQSLIGIYTVETHQYDKAWVYVHLAQKVGRRIGSEWMDRLQEKFRPQRLSFAERRGAPFSASHLRKQFSMSQTFQHQLRQGESFKLLLRRLEILGVNAAANPAMLGGMPQMQHLVIQHVLHA